MSNRIDNIRQLIIDGKEYKALNALVDLLKSEKEDNSLLNNVFLLQSRLEGIETKFNQGVTSYEKWEISRNKILKSILELTSKVETALKINNDSPKVEALKIQASIAYNSSIISRLANPELVRKMAFYYLFLWIFLGAWDTLFFQVPEGSSVDPYLVFGIEFKPYVVSESTVTWLKDFIGHLFAFGTAILVIVLGIVKSNLAQTSSSVLDTTNRLYKKYFFPYLFLILGLVAVTIFFNTSYTTQQSEIKLWSAEISPNFLPAFIASNYFALVLLPVMFPLFYYCLLLHVTIKEFKSFSAYNPFHGDKSFGLLSVGRSIFWSTLFFIAMMLLALILQLVLKNEELTHGVFLGTIVFFILLWFGAIKPLKKLSEKLKIEKKRLYESVKEEVRRNNRMLGNQSNTEDLNTIKLLLDASRDNEKELLELRTLPISSKELLIGGAIIFLLLAIIIYQIS